MDQLKYSDQCVRNPINRMGLHASPAAQGTFYLSTQDADQLPYCRTFTRRYFSLGKPLILEHLYSVTLNIGNEKVQTIGHLQATFHGSGQHSYSHVFDE